MEKKEDNFEISQGEQTDDLEEPKYSFGTDPAMVSILEAIHKYKFDVIAINIWTLARNLIDKDKSIDDNLAKLIENIEGITDSLSFTFGNVNIIKNPCVYFYLYNYSIKVPDMFLRTSNNEQKKLIKEVCSQYYKYNTSSDKKELKTFKHDNLNVIIDISQRNNFSYKTMTTVISSIPNRHKVCLLTHLPLDCHIFYSFETVVVRSHTGEVCDRIRYGETVFGIKVPFIKELHVLLGDKETLKGVFHHKTKKELLERAEAAKWSLWSSFKIEKEISYLYKLPYRLP